MKPYGALIKSLAAAALIASPSPAYAAMQYAIVGFSLGGLRSIARDINIEGATAGHSHPANCGTEHAFIYRPIGGIVDIGTLPWPYNQASWAYGMNDAGFVVGSSGTDASLQQHAFIWDPHTGIMRDIHDSRGPMSFAYAINNYNQVVGGYILERNSVQINAYLWEAQYGMRDLGSLGGPISCATEINDLAEVTGYSSPTPDRNSAHAVLWRATEGIQDLGTLGGAVSYGWHINNATEVVGVSALQDGTKRAFHWHSTSGMTALPPLAGGQNSGAQGLNNLGVIVGYSDTASGGQHGVLWHPRSQIVDLNLLLPPTSGWEINQAFNINDVGQIIGFGTLNGAAMAFVMTPLNTAPVAAVNGPYWGSEGAPLVLDGSCSHDPDGDILWFRWDYDGDGVWDTPFTMDAATSYTWHDDHSGTVFLEVSDGTLTSIACAPVMIMNQPPSVSIDEVSFAGEYLFAGEQVSFVGSVVDPGALDSHAIEWWIDGECAGTTLAVTHSFVSAGAHVVALRAVDDDGGVGSESLTVVVETAADAVGNILERVEAIRVPSGIQASLTQSLASAAASAEAGIFGAAQNKLGAFINKVEAHRGKPNGLLTQDASMLIALALEVITYRGR